MNPIAITRAFLGIVCIGALLWTNCVHPTPPASVDAGGDIFAGGSYDCTGLDTTDGQAQANRCAIGPDLGGCMVADALQTPAAELACGARDAQMLAFKQVAAGVATDDTKARAAALRAWIRDHNLTLRN